MNKLLKINILLHNTHTHTQTTLNLRCREQNESKKNVDIFIHQMIFDIDIF